MNHEAKGWKADKSGKLINCVQKVNPFHYPLKVSSMVSDLIQDI